MPGLEEFKSGFIAIVGKPNVGKSTLLNRFLGEKIVITSEKPQTTRHKIMGILSRSQAQLIFVDTPGIHNPRHLLGKYMVKIAKEAMEEVDLILFLIDATCGIEEEDSLILEILQKNKKEAILVINKIDAVNKAKVLPIIDEFHKKYNFIDYIPISATQGENIELLIQKIIENLPPGEKFYPEDQLTDRDERFVVSELIREKVLEFTYQELPYSVSVMIEEWQEREDNLVFIRAIIFVERESQKAIVIGKGARMLKKIGTQARLALERFLEKKVYLELRVKVKEAWRKDERSLKMLGYVP